MQPTRVETNGGEEYQGFAESKLLLLSAIRRAVLAPLMDKEYKVGSVSIYIRSADWGDLIRIEAATGSFVGRPTDNPDFSLADGTKSVVFTFDAESSAQEDNDYGNIFNGEVSWKGPAGVLIPYDPEANLGAAVEFEEETDSLMEPRTYFSAFSPNIYQAGALLLTIPGSLRPRVLCYGEVAGEQRVVAGVNYRGATNPDGTLGGFYEELLAFRKDAWERIAYRHASRPKTPCSFLTDGQVLTQEGLYDAAGAFVPFIRATSQSQAGGHGWKRSGTLTDIFFRDSDPTNKDNPILEWKASYSIQDSTTDITSGGSVKAQAPVMYPPPAPLTVLDGFMPIGGCRRATGGIPPYTWLGAGVDTTSGCVTTTVGQCGGAVQDSCGVVAQSVADPSQVPIVTGPAQLPGQFGVSGGHGPYIWAISGGAVIDANGYATAGSSCGRVTVTATDVCNSTSQPFGVRSPTGVWVAVLDTSYAWSSPYTNFGSTCTWNPSNETQRYIQYGWQVFPGTGTCAGMCSSCYGHRGDYPPPCNPSYVNQFPSCSVPYGGLLDYAWQRKIEYEWWCSSTVKGGTW